MKTIIILLFVCCFSVCGQEARINREPYLLIDTPTLPPEKPRLYTIMHTDTIYIQPQIINLPQETHYISAGLLISSFLIVNNMNTNTNTQRFTVYLSGAVLSTAVFFIERKLFYKDIRKSYCTKYSK